MTVRELIAELQKCDQDLPVLVNDFYLRLCWLEGPAIPLSHTTWKRPRTLEFDDAVVLSMSLIEGMTFEPLRRFNWNIDKPVLPDYVCLSLDTLISEPQRCVLSFRAWVDQPSAGLYFTKHVRKAIEVVQYGPAVDEGDFPTARRWKVSFDDAQLLPLNLDMSQNGQVIERVILSHPSYQPLDP